MADLLIWYAPDILAILLALAVLIGISEVYRIIRQPRQHNYSIRRKT